jgi:hypothetical protein
MGEFAFGWRSMAVEALTTGKDIVMGEFAFG